ncbi:hypothetical protein H8356DRAFT_1351607 [Neocallimastix lanati (nom. inval.)]|nr:hypothetical protein H8356DRAFT_1360990 [Neocallimastix sp. JGI-2020a]KAG4081646.1 hypothetical protein H8356DRAFT_1334028 [Neocallimastix sp. JGI-2020a]KAG4083064.1 hypothetical protein H8356DRAFT_1328744 [Neocallimastix sp. JGI-2020a]KAG4083798.1 hypothetical protein H8356DRAFT_1330232 [Neocallimastix sp. JGI-2020a]KAG4084081.1 hypothetical protein H8356DRAFT_1358107 [Neocallimastix sp. JGI-2020a]
MTPLVVDKVVDKDFELKIIPLSFVDKDFELKNYSIELSIKISNLKIILNKVVEKNLVLYNFY